MFQFTHFFFLKKKQRFNFKTQRLIFFKKINPTHTGTSHIAFWPFYFNFFLKK
jgi:hypothetical protein